MASDAASWSRFGYSVSILDNYAIVGAYMDDGTSFHSGSAYIYSIKMDLYGKNK